MRFTKINDNKLKIEIPMKELESYDIKFSEMSQINDKVRQLFYMIMMQAIEEVGFYIDDRTLLIEAVQKESSIDLYITKVDSPANLPFGGMGDMFKKIDMPSLEKLKRGSETAKTIPAQKPLTLYYSFEDLDKVCLACDAIKPFYKGKSALYKEDERYLLHLDFSKFKDLSYDNLSFLLKDYGEEIAPKEHTIFSAILSEHSKVIVKANAVKKLSKVV
ncbi:MAG: adaptor protein MecA [Lachnospirales bacterium]